MNKRTALNIFIGLLMPVFAFHLSVITGWVPYTLAWGGRLQNIQQMLVFECVSMAVNLLLLLTLLMEAGKIKRWWSEKTNRNILTGFAILFLLNTVGNIFAKTTFEQYFALLTLVSAILSVYILLSKPKS